MKYLAIVAMLLVAAPSFADVDSQQAIDDATAFINGAFRAAESSVTCKSAGKGAYRMTVANACSLDETETSFTSVYLNKDTESIRYNIYSLDEDVCGDNFDHTDKFLSLKDYRNAKRGVAKLCRTTLRSVE